MLQIFNRKQAAERKEGWVMGNYVFFRMHRISDIYFVGGFGTVQWVDVSEYAATQPDTIVLAEPHKTLQMMNERHAEALRKLLAKSNQPADDAAFISIDRLGTDVRVRHGNDYSVERLAFDFVRRRLSAFCLTIAVAPQCSGTLSTSAVLCYL